jgi:hypothetical protein
VFGIFVTVEKLAVECCWYHWSTSTADATTELYAPGGEQPHLMCHPANDVILVESEV